MKRLAIFLAAIILAWAGPVIAMELLDGVAAIVNDKVITYSQVRGLVSPVAQQLRRNFAGQDLIDEVRKAEADALDKLIDSALIVQEFNDKGYKIPDTSVEQQVNDIIASDYGGNRAAFVKTLEAENMTLSQFRDQTRERVIIQAMRSHKTQQAVVVSPYKIEKYYNDNLDQYKVGEQIKLRMIFIKRGDVATNETDTASASSNAVPETTATTNVVSAAETNTATTTNVVAASGTNNVATASTNLTTAASNIDANSPAVAKAPAPVDPQRELADEILAKLDAGDSFESLARVYSQSKEAEKGGDWGWISKDVLRKELNEVAFTLKAGQHSRIIDTAEGYYLLSVEDVRPAHVTPLADVRDDIEKILLQQLRAKMQDDWIKDLRGKAYIRIF